MDAEVLKRIIKSQRGEIEKTFSREKILERGGVAYAKKFLGHPNILAVLGVRRSGKSVFSLLLSKQLKERSAYINFDDERLIAVETKDLDKILQAFYELYGDVELIVLDEIQNVKGWELFANRLRRTKKVIVTGSNSRMLSGELATHLTGRYMDFTLYPLSFREVLDFKPDVYLTEDVARARRQFNGYVRGSGFPEFTKFGSSIVPRIYEDVVNKDCIRRYDIRERETFRELANYLVSNFSSEFTYSKLSKIFGIRDVHTVKNYVSYLQEAFLIIVLERFSLKLKQQVIAPKKIYAIDQGFCNFVSFSLSKNAGKVFENIVCVELLRRKSENHYMGVYYWKDHQQNEVDFVVKKGRKIQQLIQVCYDPANLEVREREIKALLQASKALRCRNLLVVTGDEEGEEKNNGEKVKFIPLWKWLLQERN